MADVSTATITSTAADTFARFAILVQTKGWIGTRCLDISKVATVLDAPPKVESC